MREPTHNVIVRSPNATEWELIARLLGPLHSIVYDPWRNEARLVHYDPATGEVRQLEEN